MTESDSDDDLSLKDRKAKLLSAAAADNGGDAAVAAAAAHAGAEEKDCEEYYLIPKKACRECGKRLPLQVKKTKYKKEAVRNKVKLVCANQECRGRRMPPRCKGWDIWFPRGSNGGGHGEGRGGSSGCDKREQQNIDSDGEEEEAGSRHSMFEVNV
jgi:hypothetical protein